jgi:hypothetical protein
VNSLNQESAFRWEALACGRCGGDTFVIALQTRNGYNVDLRLATLVIVGHITTAIVR